MTFITKSTKVNAIVACAIIGVLLLTLVMVSTLIMVSYRTKVVISFIYAVSVLVITLLWQGILKLKVFSDYKCQNRLLCAEGVISIVISVLLLISGALFGALQFGGVIGGEVILGADIRIFISIFIGVLALWKLITFLATIKVKHFGKWYDLAITIGLLGLTSVCIISMFTTTLEVVAWVSMSICWLLILLYLAYLLHCFVITNPTYLETDKAKEIYEKEQEDIQLEEQMVRAKVIKKATSTRDVGRTNINAKLRKLRELKDTGLISDKNYEEKKQDILNEL